MLVDDAVVVRGLFARWVESEPDLDVVATLRTGREAVDQLGRVDPDVVVLDVDMPDLDGIEVARRLRADPVTANVRLALHTGLALAAVRERFTDYDAFIPKAEDAEELIAAIKAAIEQPPRSASAPGAAIAAA
jgi:two-component system chemotaxis response regulator CheB